MVSSKHVVSLKIIKAKQEKVYKKIFDREFLQSKDNLYLEEFPLIIFPEDFYHICYESETGGGYKKKFSLRRARKILLIKDICLGKIPYKIIYQNQRENRSICVLLEYAEFAIFVLPQKSKKGTFLRLLTIISYGKQVESVIKKQKKRGVKVESIKEAVRLRGSTAPEGRQINKYPT